MRWRGRNRSKKMSADEVRLPPSSGYSRILGGDLFLEEPIPLRFEDIFNCANEQEAIWRMKGYLDCLRAMNEYGPPDPRFVEYLIEKTGEKAP